LGIGNWALGRWALGIDTRARGGRQGRPMRAHLLQREVHRHRHDDRHGLAVHERRDELPLHDGTERSLVELRNRAQHAGVADGSVGLDARLDDDDALDAGIARFLRIHGLDVADLRRWLHAAADAQCAVGCPLRLGGTPPPRSLRRRLPRPQGRCAVEPGRRAARRSSGTGHEAEAHRECDRRLGGRLVAHRRTPSIADFVSASMIHNAFAASASPSLAANLSRSVAEVLLKLTLSCGTSELNETLVGRTSATRPVVSSVTRITTFPRAPEVAISGGTRRGRDEPLGIGFSGVIRFRTLLERSRLSRGRSGLRGLLHRERTDGVPASASHHHRHHGARYDDSFRRHHGLPGNQHHPAEQVPPPRERGRGRQRGAVGEREERLDVGAAPPVRVTTVSSTTSSRASCTREISHHIAGWNQSAARTSSAPTIHAQSRPLDVNEFVRQDGATDFRAVCAQRVRHEHDRAQGRRR